MLKILSYIGTFIAGGMITLVVYSALILAKESDKYIEIEDKSK